MKRQQAEQVFFPPDSYLVSLCRDAKWDQVLTRCQTHPNEADPVLECHVSPFSPIQPLKRDRKEFISNYAPIYKQTALGVVCGSDIPHTRLKSELILKLFQVSPNQLCVSQKVTGYTPLRDLISCGSCECDHLAALLDMDMHMGFTAIRCRDLSGLTPIDHLIMRFHLDPCERNFALFCCYVDRVEIHSPSMPTSAIIRLLSSASCEIPDSQRKDATFDMVLRCTKYLLARNPIRIDDKAIATQCTVLHVALRNFGDHAELIRFLLANERSRAMLSTRNVFGDLPLHVACAGGSPIDVLKLVLIRSLEILPMPEEGPHSLLWSANGSGYTPVDLEWMRHIEGGGGLYERRSFYPLEERGLRCPSARHEGMYKTLLRKAVGQAMTSGTRDTYFFGALLHRIILIVQMAYSGKSIRDDYLLHAASSLTSDCGSTLPEPLLFLFHWKCEDGVKTCDFKGRLPLHYALMSHTVSVRSGYRDNESSSEETKYNVWVDMLIESYPKGARVVDGKGRLPLHYALDAASSQKDNVTKLIQLFPDSVERRDPVTGLYPFQQASLSSISVSFELLRRAPTLVRSS
jgi:hypothetical protein